MRTINHTRRAGAVLLAGGALGALVLTLLVPGLSPLSPKPADAQGTQSKSSCSVSYGALDPNDPTKVNPAKLDPSDGRLVPGAIGVPVVQRDEAGIKAELQQRRTCDTDGKFDPEVTASHYADWSAEGLTNRKVDFKDIDAFRAEITANPDLYASVVKELVSLENASAFSLENEPAGVWSVFIVPDGHGGLTTHIGTTSHAGTAAVFTHGTAVIKYRLECGFQILRTTPPPGMPQCTYKECNPTPPCEETGTCPPPPPSCPPGWHGTYPVCKDPASDDPYPSGNAPTGGGPNADPGPGTLKPTPSQPPSTPRVNPAPPTTVTAPPVTVGQTPSDPPTVDTSTQNNNGNVPATGSGPGCNSDFQSC